MASYIFCDLCYMGENVSFSSGFDLWKTDLFSSLRLRENCFRVDPSLHIPYHGVVKKDGITNYIVIICRHWRVGVGLYINSNLVISPI